MKKYELKITVLRRYCRTCIVIMLVLMAPHKISPYKINVELSNYTIGGNSKIESPINDYSSHKAIESGSFSEFQLDESDWVDFTTGSMA